MQHYLTFHYTYMQLEFLREMKLTWEECADVLLLSRTTLWRKTKELGLTCSSYSEVSNTELDAVMEKLTDEFPNNGCILLWGHLRSSGIFVTRRRVRESLDRVCPMGVTRRLLTTIHRRTYNVPAPNLLWHIHGLHCLIRWRIVIHGGIDGNSRRVVYLKASANNRSKTVVLECC